MLALVVSACAHLAGSIKVSKIHGKLGAVMAKQLGQNRIVEVVEMDSSKLCDHTGNFRRHPKAQKDAFAGLLSEVGRAGALVAYHSERNDGSLTLIDGHLRRDIGGAWTVLVTDLTDEEADKLLQAYDPIGHMAVIDRDMLRDLREKGAFEDAMIQSVVDDKIVPESLKSALTDSAMPFEPDLAPKSATGTVSAEQAQAASDNLMNKHKNLSSAEAHKHTEVTCPHCGEDFLITKQD